MKKNISNTLEENNMYEICKHCESLNIIDINDEDVWCTNCETMNYTRFVTEEELIKIQKQDV